MNVFLASTRDFPHFGGNWKQQKFETLKVMSYIKTLFEMISHLWFEPGASNKKRREVKEKPMANAVEKNFMSVASHIPSPSPAPFTQKSCFFLNSNDFWVLNQFLVFLFSSYVASLSLPFKTPIKVISFIGRHARRRKLLGRTHSNPPT